MRRALLVGGVAIVLLVGGVWWWRSRPAPATSPQSAAAVSPPSPSSAAATSSALVASQAALETDIAANGVTPDKAKLLFSIAIAPLPGVTVPRDVVRDRTQFDGTLAVGYLYQVWEFLTPEQRHAAAHWIQRSAPRNAGR